MSCNDCLVWRICKWMLFCFLEKKQSRSSIINLLQYPESTIQHMNLSPYLTYRRCNISVEWCWCVRGLENHRALYRGTCSNVERYTFHLEKKGKTLYVCDYFFHLWKLHLPLVFWSRRYFTFSQDCSACLSQTWKIKA